MDEQIELETINEKGVLNGKNEPLVVHICLICNKGMLANNAHLNSGVFCAFSSFYVNENNILTNE